MSTLPDRKFLRSDRTIDQRAFDARHQEVGLDTQDTDQVWTDILSVGKKFLKNIADSTLAVSTQPNRSEILVTRLESSQQTRAVSFSAKSHEHPNTTMHHNDTQAHIPREDERRSLTTARHQRNTRASWIVFNESKDAGTARRRLALGGFKTNLGSRYKQEDVEFERLEKIRNEKERQRAQYQSQDNIQF